MHGSLVCIVVLPATSRKAPVSLHASVRLADQYVRPLRGCGSSIRELVQEAETYKAIDAESVGKVEDVHTEVGDGESQRPKSRHMQ